MELHPKVHMQVVYFRKWSQVTKVGVWRGNAHVKMCSARVASCCLRSILNVPQDCSPEEKSGEFICGHFPSPHPDSMLTLLTSRLHAYKCWFPAAIKILPLQSQRWKGKKSEQWCPWGERLCSYIWVKLILAAIVGTQGGPKEWWLASKHMECAVSEGC